MARQGKLLDYSEESPNLRVRLTRPHLSEQQVRSITREFAKKVLAIVHNNIRNGGRGSGRWKLVQWGPKAGQKALQGTEYQWGIELISSTQAKVTPKRRYLKRWRGHTQGMTLYPKKKRFMKISYSDGTVIFAKKAKLPKRDPRPTAVQLRRLQNGS